MARNFEKRFTGLNRFLEAKQKAENKEKAEKRPHLHQLKTTEEIKYWIPSINKEINYLLQQISGSRNYPDRKIEEFKARVDELKKKHGKFVAKVGTLDPNYKDVIPWKPRGYQRKRPHGHQLQADHEIKQSNDSHVGKRSQEGDTSQIGSQDVSICKSDITIGDKEKVCSRMVDVRVPSRSLADNDTWSESPDCHMMHEREKAQSAAVSSANMTGGKWLDDPIMMQVREPAQSSVAVVIKHSESPDSHMTSDAGQPAREVLVGRQNVLKLDYSSSSDSELEDDGSDDLKTRHKRQKLG